MRAIAFHVFLIISVFLMSGCEHRAPEPKSAPGSPTAKQPASSAWPMFRADEHNSGYAAVKGPSNPVVLWKSKPILGSNVLTDISPVLGEDGTLYCSIADAAYAIEPGGKMRWKLKNVGGTWKGSPTGGAYSPAVARDGTAYIATDSFVSDFPIQTDVPGRLCAVDSDGRLLWTCKDGTPETYPLLDKQGQVYCIMRHEREPTDLHPFGTSYFAVTVIDSQGNTARKVQPVGVGGGWRRIALRHSSAGTDVYCAGGNTVCRIDPAGRVLAVKVGRRTTKHIYGPSVTGLSLSTEPDAVYVCTEDGGVTRLSASSLNTEWRIKAGNKANFVNPAVSREGVYVITDSKRLTCISHDGKIRWHVDLPVRTYSSPAVDSQGSVFVTGGGKLFCVGNDGKIRWDIVVSKKEIVSSPILGPDGTVYCYSDRACAVGEAKRSGAKP